MTTGLRFELGILITVCLMVSGTQANARDSSFTLDAAYTTEVWTLAAGGLDRGTGYLDNFDLTLEIDADEAWGLPGATFFLYALGNSNNTLSDSMFGDAQVISNIDTIGAVRLFEAWYEQEFFYGGLSVKAGLIDLNSEFDANDTRGLFINSSHGIGPDFSQAGVNGPSIFPNTSLALRARVRIADGWAFQSAIFDGVPGDPDHPRRTAIKLGNGDGALIVNEIQYANNSGTGIAAGSWLFTADIDDLLKVDVLGNPVQRQANWGAYISGEQVVFREAIDPDQGASLFLRVGMADKNVNQLKRFIGAGVVYNGPFAARGDDQIGFALAIAKNGGPFLLTQQLAGVRVKNREIALELTYRYNLLPHVTIQPDMQLVVNPSMDPGTKNVWAFGLRMEMGL